ncbi:MAG: hypothetical protein J6U54_18030 [Clostridiales bacterium]|nr:hypothetical protein [Clostridiales bacterium]
MIRKESDYHVWLRTLVGNCRHYTRLIQQLDDTPYTWIFNLDSNRAEGGKSLREKYAYHASVEADDVRTSPCTVLEMLISVADHMTDQLGEDIATWFWVIIDNLGLNSYTDDDYYPQGVDVKLNNWMRHEYGADGVGSIFPLQHYRGDCRNLDVWSQMNAWINENYPSDNSWLNL